MVAKKSVKGKSVKGKKVLDIVINKDKTSVVLEIKIDEELEKLFKTMANDNKDLSTNWFSNSTYSKGLEFYQKTQSLEDFRNDLIEKGLNFYDDFGSGFLNGSSSPNIALLRIVGASKGIKVFSNRACSFDEIKRFVDCLVPVVKTIYQVFIAKAEVRASINIIL